MAADKVVVIPLNRTMQGEKGDSWDTPTEVISNGQTWMDRNLGASRVAGSSSDSLAYGWLYQWGRLADGHEDRNSPVTGISSGTDVPGHGDFITEDISPFDWIDPQNNDLWQGSTGTSNPCPAGFRLPTELEWETERTSWGSGTNNSTGAYASPLKLVVAGYRNRSDGTIYLAGSLGYYWGSTVDGGNSCTLGFVSDNAEMISSARANGFSARCLKD